MNQRKPSCPVHILLVLLLTAVALLPVHAAGNPLDLHFETLDNTHGLPTNAIRRIIQDSEGYMWFATDNGIVQYDGYYFNTLKNDILHPEILTSNIIRSLADSPHYIWIGTDHGLNRYIKNERTTEAVSLSQDIDHSTINRILVESDHSLWLATSSGIVHFDPTTGHYKVHSQVANSTFRTYGTQDIFLDSRGQLWFALWNGGLVRYDRSTDTLIAYPQLNPANSATTLAEDLSGQLWIGTWGYGLYRMVPGTDAAHTTYEHYSAQPSGSVSAIGSNYIYAICQDTDQHYLWIGHRRGLSIIPQPHSRTPQFVNYTTSQSNSHISDLADLNSICVDHSGIIWLGNLNSGIHKVNLKNHPLEYNPLEYIHEAVGTSYITSMLSIRPNVFWFGIRNNGMWIYHADSGTCTPFSAYLSEPRLNTDAFILDIKHIKSLDEVWVTVRNKGVFRITIDGQGRPVSSKLLGKKKYNNKALLVHEDSHSNIWLLSSIGVCVKTPGQGWIHFNNFAKTYKTCVAQCIAEDREGNLWIGTRNHGIFKFVPSGSTFSMSQYSIQNSGISHMDVTAILVDSQRRIWAATNGGGLTLYNRESNIFEEVNSRYNIPCDLIFNIFEDSQHNIWLNNENSLVQLNTSLGSVRELNVTDNLWDNMFSPTCSVLKLPHNRVMIGGSLGYNILNCSAPISQPGTSTPAITNIYLSGSSVYQTHPQLFASARPHLEFTHKENNPMFSFSSLIYDNPKKHRYQYRLLGYDDEWHLSLPGQHMASYTNLPHGRYTFQVKLAGLSSGSTDSQVASCPFTIRPSVFNTWYAWLLYVLFSGLLLYLLIRTAYVRERLKRQVAIATEHEKTAEALVQTKLRFFTNISHDLLTPLTVIKCALDNIKQEGVDDVITTTMRNNINYLNRLIRQILEFRKMENDKLKLKVQYGNISTLVRDICQTNIAPLLQTKDLTMELHFPTDDIIGWFDSDKLDKIVYNLLSNAYKYNHRHGQIIVSLTTVPSIKGQMLELQIADTGIGIPNDQLPKIFDRFYDGEYRKQHVTGTGIGLSLVKGLVELHGGSISVTSQLGKGTTFTVSLPIDIQAFEYVNLEIQSDAVISDSADSADEPLASGELYGQGRKILLVDDNPDLLLVVTNLLKEHYSVSVAENGLKALDYLHQQSVDLVVSDVMMPEMDGFELCRAIKSDITISHIPIILLTAKVTEEERMKGYDVGAIGYITKPFTPAALLKRISSVLRNKATLMKHFMQQDNMDVKIEGYTSIDREFMQKITDLVVKNLDNSEFDIEQFASEMNMSKSTLYRKLKDMTQLSPVDFIKSIRLKRSRQLLLARTSNVSQVAYAVGFSDPKYFSRCFKKEFGMSPNEYIHSQKQQASPSMTDCQSDDKPESQPNSQPESQP